VNVTKVSQTPAEILTSITERRDDEIVGAYESQSVDFKGTYRLAEPSEKWELAKDIAAFANAGGGLIAVGFTTVMDVDRAEERVSDVRPIPADMFDPKQIYDIAETWVYPPPKIKVIRYPREAGVLGTIEVQADGNDEPFLVTRMPDEGGKLVGQVAVGWPRRNGTHTTWTPVGQIHRHLRPATPGSGSTVPPPAASTMPHPIEAKQLAEQVDTSMGWSDRAVLYLVGRPAVPQTSILPGFYAADGVLGAVQRPLELRYAGFGLTYGHQVETDADGRIVSNDDERVLLLRPDGISIAALSAAPHFLTRGSGEQSPQAPGPRRINPIVVTEWTYLFCRLIADKLAPAVDSGWELFIGLIGAKTRPWSLAAIEGRQASSDIWFLDGKPSRVDNWEQRLPATLDPGADAYRMLSALYEVFGLDYDTVGLAPDKRVDPEMIAAIR